MRDGGDLAIGGGTDADALDGGGTVGRVVEHQWPRERDFHRSAGHACTERRQHRVGTNEQLAAETAANVGRNQPHILLRYTEGCRQIGDGPVDHLIGGPQGQLVAVPRRH
ncbi:hypothetical protein D3C85_1395120 [compost metagenome]